MTPERSGRVSSVTSDSHYRVSVRSDSLPDDAVSRELLSHPDSSLQLARVPNRTVFGENFSNLWSLWTPIKEKKRGEIGATKGGPGNQKNSRAINKTTFENRLSENTIMSSPKK
jgi:hypothetical protein